jgi:hypothetical protein
MSLPQDRSRDQHDGDRVGLLAPLIVLVLGATAIPVELRRFDFASLSWDCNARDLVANVTLYVPVGMVLTGLGLWRAVMIAALISLFAESCQFFIAHRYPSPIDLTLNVAGAITGLLIGRRWRIQAPTIRASVRTAWLSLLMAVPVLAALLIRWLHAPPDWRSLSVNCRGATVPGSLEAYWTFDEAVGGVVHDSSGNGLDGRLMGGTALAEGIRGMAIRLDRPDDYVDFGHTVELCLMGSMTISAWIKSSSFPVDDAAIVSSNGPGYQLDTTVDSGPRTIGFKIVDPCGNVMARLGATELLRDTWYHVAGVYDADTRALNVYLNGHLDDGILEGRVVAAQQASSQSVFVGRRAELRGYEFAGLIDDVRIYTRPLTQAEIERDMNGVGIGGHPAEKAVLGWAGDILKKRASSLANHWHQPTRDEDTLVPGLIAAVGVLSALACAGFWPGHRLAILGVSAAVGLLIFPVAAVALPPNTRWMLPWLSLAGGSSVAFSLVRASRGTSDWASAAARPMFAPRRSSGPPS